MFGLSSLAAAVSSSAPPLAAHPISGTFMAFGRRSCPRWLIPQGSHLTPHAFQGWTPHRAASRLLWSAMKAALFCGALSQLGKINTVKIGWLRHVDWKTLGWRRQSSPVPLIYLGTPGPRRKAVFHLIAEESGECELIVKVAMTQAAVGAIRHEAEVLTQLETEGFGCAPRMLHVDRVRGVVSQTVVDGSHSEAQFTSSLADLMEALALPEMTTLSHAASALHRMWTNCSPRKIDGYLVSECLQEMADTTELPAYWVHGDFAPWNIKLRTDGSAALVDWENGHRGGLPLQDAFHFVHLQRFLFGREPQPAFEEVRQVARSPLSAALCRKLELAYLLERYLQQDEADCRALASFFATTIRLTLNTY